MDCYFTFSVIKWPQLSHETLTTLLKFCFVKNTSSIQRGIKQKIFRIRDLKRDFLEFSLHPSPAASKGLLNFAANLMIQTASVLNRQHKKQSNPIPEKSERKDPPLNVNTTTFFWDLSLALPQMLEHSNTYWGKSNLWPTGKNGILEIFPNRKGREKRIHGDCLYCIKHS